MSLTRQLAVPAVRTINKIEIYIDSIHAYYITL